MVTGEESETKYCELEHQKMELREAVAEMLLTCPDCKVEWSTPVCRGHGSMAQLLIVVGGDMDCPVCRAELPAQTYLKLGDL